MTGRDLTNATEKGASPARFKNFVRDIKGFTKDLRRNRQGVSSKDIISAKQQLQSEELSFTTEDLIVPDIPAKQQLQNEEPIATIEDVAASVAPSDADTKSIFRDSPHLRSLSVRVTIIFGEPLNYSHSQDYESSTSLQPTEDLCEALLRRVDHCSQELITRKDSSALDRTDVDGKAKPLRFEIQTQVLRHEMSTGTETWASRTLRSYQRQPLCSGDSREVILFTHNMIGLFLRHHDEAFFWRESAIRGDPSHELKSYQYEPARVQPLTTIPRFYFIEKQQRFESTPGYTINFSITSQNHHRRPSEWSDTVEINSHQSSPLTFAKAETLFLDACFAVDGVFMKERKAFENLQKPCANHSGCSNCRLHEGNGVKITVSVNNNVGPLYDNLERTTRSSINMFRKEQAKDCIDFVDSIKAAIEQVRHETDESVTHMNDFEFYISQLRGQDWTIDEPLAFTLGPEKFLDRRTVEALLDRLQTGVAEMLQGNAISVKMAARKRGHSILHKTLVAREPMVKPGAKKKPMNKSKSYVLDRLKQRIEHDIDMVCKDTCSILDREMETTQVNGLLSAPSQVYGSMDASSTSSRKFSDATTPSRQATDKDSSVGKLGSIRSESSGLPELLSNPSSVPPRPCTGGTEDTRDSNTGVRLSPLLLDGLVHSELNAINSELASLNNNFARNNATATSLHSTVSHGKPPTLYARPTASIMPRRDQGATRTSSTSSNIHGEWYNREEAASIRPQTPSLESGSSPSIRSSVLSNERVHEHAPNHEVPILWNSTPDIESGDEEHVDKYLRKFYMRRSSSPVPRPFSQVSSVPSSIGEARVAHKEKPYRGPYNDHISTHETAGCSQSELETAPKLRRPPVVIRRVSTQSAKRATVITTPVPKIIPPPKLEPRRSSSPESKPDVDSPLTTSDTEDSKAATSSSTQSKSERDSSLATSDTNDRDATQKPPSSSYERTVSATIQDAEDPETSCADLSESSDDDDDDTLGPSAPTILPQQRLNMKSFGNGSYLGGFHSVGLRRPVLGTSAPPRPFTPGTSHDTEMPASQPLPPVPENSSPPNT